MRASIILSISFALISVFFMLFAPGIIGVMGERFHLNKFFFLLLLGLPGMVLGYGERKTQDETRAKAAKITIKISYTTICFLIIITFLSIKKDREIQTTVFIQDTRSKIEIIGNALEWYKLDCGVYPTKKIGLKALIFDPKVAGWSGPYLLTRKKLFIDNWGKLIKFRIHDSLLDVYSAGPDKKYETNDDITLERE
jgi:hypothetical protein